MRVPAFVFGALTFAASAASAAGGQALSPAAIAAAAEWKPSISLSVQKTAPKAPSVDWNRRPQDDQNQAAKPSVVCGMTLMKADPKFDAKMRVAPKDTGTAFTMRSVEPTICKQP